MRSALVISRLLHDRRLLEYAASGSESMLVVVCVRSDLGFCLRINLVLR